MSEEKIVFPEDVIVEVNPNPTYIAKRPGESKVVAISTTEEGARKEASTHQHCEKCGAATHKYFIYCQKCTDEKRLAEAKEWDGEFPVFIDDEFFYDEDNFVDHIYDNELEVDKIELYSACPNMASRVHSGRVSELFEGIQADDHDLPSEITDAIKEFCEKLEAIKDPISWSADKRLRMTPEQIAKYQKMIQPEGENHE